jgi:hypothetical protein
MHRRRTTAKFQTECALGLLLVIGCQSARTNPKASVQSAVGELPLGSSAVQVTGYLDSHKIEHSQYRRNGTNGNSLDAFVHYDPSTWDVVKTSYQIVFRFDNHDRLISKEVHPEYTGP